jgi:rhodanese-related sulfurtransferase
MTDNKTITVGEFIGLFAVNDASSLLLDEPSDIYDTVLIRSEAAKLIHRFIKKILGEKDIDVSLWHAASVLKDLYDCRVCVSDIVEVYLKGIMDAKVTNDGDIIFALKAPVSLKEAKTLVSKTLNVSERTPVKAGDISVNKLKRTDKETALSLILQSKRAVLIDLRMPADFETGHMKGAVNIPLSEYVKNPYLAGPEKDALIFFYCENGYKSEIAGNLALSMGYKNCYVVL